MRDHSPLPARPAGSAARRAHRVSPGGSHRVSLHHTLLGGTLLGALLLAAGCAADPKPAAEAGDDRPADTAAGSDGGGDGGGPAPVPPGCGDGRVEGSEECDDGDANSDELPDACRLDCSAPGCGDGVIDAGEACEPPEGGPATACRPDCSLSDALLEVEPNDSAAEATPAADLSGGSAAVRVEGALGPEDRDCLRVEAAVCESLEIEQVLGCEDGVSISLQRPDGTMVAAAGPAEDGCARIRPEEAAGARFVEAGPYAVCLEGLRGEVPRWGLDLRRLPPLAGRYTLPADQDQDQDGLPTNCDEDIDGDGVLNADDDCPEVPNGPGEDPLGPSASGFIRDMLAAGPYTGTSSADRCAPSTEPLLGGDDDSVVVPVLGEAAGAHSWALLHSPTDRIELLTDFGGVSAPREVYLAVYVRSDGPRAATLALGPDDGARAWLDGAQVLDVASCQGTNVDQFTGAVSLTGDWQRLVIKVRDQGGGFGTYIRLLEGGAPMTSLQLALDPTGADLFDQGDRDGDGIGDVCDPTP